MIQRLAIAFVDDTSFNLSRTDFQYKIQMIVNEQTRLYKAIGGLIKHNKSYAWKWKKVKGK